MTQSRESDNHPIWDVHEVSRTARLNVKYYCIILSRLETRDKFIDIFSAITTPSTVVGLTIWQTDWGKWVWGITGAVTGALAAVRPFLKYPERIKILRELITDYQRLEHDTLDINTKAREKGCYDESLQSKFDSIREDYRQIKTKLQERSNKKLSKACQEEVLKELPTEFFYVPK